MRRYDIPMLEYFFAQELVAVSETTQITVYEQRRKKKGQRIRHCKFSVPEEYLLCDPNSGEHIVAPELAYLQVAHDLPFHRRLLLALLICAKEPGSNLPALSTRERLRACVTAIPGHRGRRRALQALKYVRDNCNSQSFVEPILFMFLALPNCLGGMGITDLAFNRRFEFTEEERATFRKSCLYSDFVSEQWRLAIEYDSDAYHGRNDSDPKRRSQSDLDVARATILGARKYEALSLRTPQLYKPRQFEMFIREMFRRAGKYIRIRTERFWDMFQEIAALLPRSEAVIPHEVGSDVRRLMSYERAIEFGRQRDALARAEMFGGPRRWRLVTQPVGERPAGERPAGERPEPNSGADGSNVG